jgi:hypothetical protein
LLPRIKLTKTAVENLPPVAHGKPALYVDTQEAG